MCGEHVFAQLRGRGEEGRDGESDTREDDDAVDNVECEGCGVEEDVLRDPLGCWGLGVGGAGEDCDSDEEDATAEEEDVEDYEDREDLFVGHCVGRV